MAIPSDRWIVVGGGASGLAAAHFLRQQGLDPVLLEQGGAIGGRMGTIRLGDRDLDCGGKNIGRRYRLFREFAASLGAHPLEPFGLNSSQAIGGRLQTFDAASRWTALARLARGASLTDLTRFGRLLWRVRADEDAGFLGSPFARAWGARYDAHAAARYFSPDFSERILRPMTVRMNGAEPDEVYMGTLASNVRMLLDTYDQFANGLSPLLDACRARYDICVDTRAESLVTDGRRVTGVRVRHAGRTRTLHGAGVIVATPADAAASLVAPSLPSLAARLRQVAYHPVMLILAEYDRPVFTPDVRALVFGPAEAVSNAGVYGVADRHIVRYTFSGRQFRRCLADGIGPATLLARAEAVLSEHAPVADAVRRRFVTRLYGTGLCAYTCDHGRFLDALRREQQQVEGLYLTGDYLQGASIEACFRSAAACVHTLARRRPPFVVARSA